MQKSYFHSDLVFSETLLEYDDIFNNSSLHYQRGKNILITIHKNEQYIHLEQYKIEQVKIDKETVTLNEKIMLLNAGTFFTTIYTKFYIIKKNGAETPPSNDGAI